jgi:hypothetical protein
MPSARASDVFDNVYEDPPPRVRRQRDELARLSGAS